ncbi:hypothetical protein BSKO_10246 [Bryopsis sp. KO-2023]|nr:hypothetical protein BSKO_10246 [Bryopsis sp. KO-2023]
MDASRKPFDEWTVKELQGELESRGLPTTGLKADLVERIQEAVGDERAQFHFQPIEVQAAQANGEKQNGEASGLVNGVEGVDAVGVAIGDPQSLSKEDQPVGTEAEPSALVASAGGEVRMEGDGCEERDEDGCREWGPPEWEKMDIPEAWRPFPLLVVKGIPVGTELGAVKSVLENSGLSVRTVAYEEAISEDVPRTALVRLAPLPLPWLGSRDAVDEPAVAPPKTLACKQENDGIRTAAKIDGDVSATPAEAKPENAEGDGGPPSTVNTDGECEEQGEGAGTNGGPQNGEVELGDRMKTEEDANRLENLAPVDEVDIPSDDGTEDGDTWKRAKYFVAKLTSEKLSLGNSQLSFDAPELRTTIFVCNLPKDLHVDENLKATMTQFGSVERCFVLRNKEGASKDYAFVEYTHPSSAENAKQVLDKQASEGFERLFALRGRRFESTTPGPTPISSTATPIPGSEDGGAELMGENAEEGATVDPTSVDGGSECELANRGENDTTTVNLKSEDRMDQVDGTSGGDAPMKEEEVPETVGTVAEANDVTDMGVNVNASAGPESTSGEKSLEQPTSSATVRSVQLPIELNSTQMPANPMVSHSHSSLCLMERDVKEKVIRVEWSWTNTVDSMFSRTIYVSNLLSSVNRDSPDLKVTFESFGPVRNWNVLKSKVTGYGKTYAFVEYFMSEHAEAAFQAWDQKQHPVLGYLLISFVNPAKLYELDKRRRQNKRPFVYPPPARSVGGRFGAAPTKPMGRGSSMHQSAMVYPSRTVPSPIRTPAAQPQSNVAIAQVLAQQQLAARMQLQQMNSLFQRQTAQLHAYYQAQLRTMQAQAQKVQEQAVADKRAQVVMAAAQQQAPSQKVSGHLPAYKDTTAGGQTGGSRLLSGTQATGQTALGTGQTQSGHYQQQGYTYSNSQQESQQGYNQNYYGSGYSQQQQAAVQQTYNQSGSYPQSYTSGTSQQVYGQQTGSGYAGQTTGTYGSQPMAAYGSQTANATTNYGMQAGVAYGGQQAGGFTNQAAGGYGTQMGSTYGAQAGSGYVQSASTYGSGTPGASGYGTQQSTYTTPSYSTTQYSATAYPQTTSGYATQSSYTQGAYGQAGYAQQQGSYGYGQGVVQTAAAVQQTAAVAGQKRDSSYVYQQGYDYSQVQDQQQAADYTKRPRYS